MSIFKLLFRSTYVDRNGYRRFTDSDKLVHRWVAAKDRGRKLTKSEVVHHKDRNKLNNSPFNLHVFRNQSQHNRVHQYDAKRFGKAYSFKGKKKARGSLLDWFW